MAKKIIKPIKADFDDLAKALVTKGVAANEHIDKSTHAGDLTIGDMTIPCAVIGDGVRVLSNRGINTTFTGKRGGGVVTKDGAQNLPRFLALSSIKPFISKDLMARLNNPIEYQPIHGGRSAYGYEATMLPEICEVIIDADRAGELRDKNQALVADSLLRGFARIGVIALVDEATGYQDDRARDALEKILTEFLTEERQKWAKTFPLDFYREIYRLRGWPFNPWTTKRPSVIASWTDNFVYDRLAPGLTKELRNKNPKAGAGRRKDKHHQWFNPDQGHPRLREHISGVTALLRAAENWDSFKTSIDRAYPKFGDTIQLPLTGGRTKD